MSERLRGGNGGPAGRRAAVLTCAALGRIRRPRPPLRRRTLAVKKKTARNEPRGNAEHPQKLLIANGYEAAKGRRAARVHALLVSLLGWGGGERRVPSPAELVKELQRRIPAKSGLVASSLGMPHIRVLEGEGLLPGSGRRRSAPCTPALTQRWCCCCSRRSPGGPGEAGGGGGRGGCGRAGGDHPGPGPAARDGGYDPLRRPAGPDARGDGRGVHGVPGSGIGRGGVGRAIRPDERRAGRPAGPTAGLAERETPGKGRCLLARNMRDVQNVAGVVRAVGVKWGRPQA